MCVRPRLASSRPSRAARSTALGAHTDRPRPQYSYSMCFIWMCQIRRLTNHTHNTELIHCDSILLYLLDLTSGVGGASCGPQARAASRSWRSSICSGTAARRWPRTWPPTTTSTNSNKSTNNYDDNNNSNSTTKNTI